MSEGAVLDALGRDPADVDTLVARTGLSAAEVIVQLTGLELTGDVAPLPGGRWQRTSMRPVDAARIKGAALIA